MRKQRIEYNSPVDALVAIAKRLQSFEYSYKITSEEFYNSFAKGQLDDSIDFTEWSNDYRHYLAIRTEIEGLLRHVA